MPNRGISIALIVVFLLGAVLTAVAPVAQAAPRGRATSQERAHAKERAGGKKQDADKKRASDKKQDADKKRAEAKKRANEKERTGDQEVAGGSAIPADNPVDSGEQVPAGDAVPAGDETAADDETAAGDETPAGSEEAAGSDEVTSDPQALSTQDVSDGAGTYIVVLDQAPGRGRGAAVREEARAVGREHGLGVTQVYDTALAGFAAEVPNAAALKRLKNDPRVASVEPDRQLEAFADDFPTGIDRVGADATRENTLPTRAGAPVAVLDTGIDASHDDLAGVVRGGINCTTPGGASPSFGVDIEGHGTHVAGTISALNNGIGVVGVAPGTPLYDVKVLGDDRVGQTSWIICGLDWVSKNAATSGIKVVNMSLGGTAVAADHNACGTTTTALHNAICGAKAAGVRITVAAGNSSIDANTIVPATYNEVTTVSALVDSDGCTGGKGRTLNAGADDTRANFSNTGPDLDVAAPGARVISTAPGDLYDQRSGTSMATPHVSAAMALGWTGAEETRKGLPEGILKVSGNIGC